MERKTPAGIKSGRGFPQQGFAESVPIHYNKNNDRQKSHTAGRPENTMEDTENLLDKENMKKTKARKWILEILKNSLPMTAGEIFESMKKKQASLSLSTVYRNCEVMSEKGLLMKSSLLEDGLTRYEYPKFSHTHHAICLGCGRIFSISECPFGEFEQLMESKYDFGVVRHRIEIYGYCHECREKMRREGKKMPAEEKADK